MTATAAGTVLCALWFVPSAKAAPDAPGAAAHHAVTQHSGPARDADPAPPSGADGQAPAAAGTTASGAAHPGTDGLTTPVVLSTLVLAGAGGALVLRTRRRAATVSSRSAQASSPVAD